MKTAAITAYGGPEVLSIHDAPAPEPRPGKALVAVVASTINPVDVKTRTPGTPQRVGRFPAVLGWDIAGVVITAPEGSGWAPGDRVIAMHPPAPDGSGSWQQYAAIPAERLSRHPSQSTCLPLPRCPWRRSRPIRLSGDSTFVTASGCWSPGPRAAWAGWPCSSPRQQGST